MKKCAYALFALGLLCAFAPSAVNATPPTTVTIFHGRGASATVFLGGVGINGIGTRTVVTVVRDDTTGDTSLSLSPRSGPAPNRTVYFATGTIPSSDFVLAPDLSSASLNTVVNTSPGQFDNADLGPISNLVISLTWTSDAFGTLVDTSTFNESTGDTPPQTFRETYHQNGPHAEGSVSGSFDGIAISNQFGSLDQNRSVDVVRFR